MNRQGVMARRVQVTGAIFLCGGYLQDVLMTLQSLTISRDAQGTWQVLSDPTSISRVGALFAFLMILAGLLTFATGYLIRRYSRPIEVGQGGWEDRPSRLTWRDLCLVSGWVALLFFGGMYGYYFGLSALLPQALRHNAGLAALGSVSMQIAAILIIPYYYRRHRQEIGLSRPVISWRMLLYVVVFFTTIFALSMVTQSIGEWLGINTNSYREQSISRELHSAWWQSGWAWKLLPMFATSLIAPVGEELLFRGALQSTIAAKWGQVTGILLSSALFALIHADLVLLLPLLCMGLLFSTLRWLTGSLWAPIWLHALNNFYSSLLDLLQ